jgi:hypothetical protein
MKTPLPWNGTCTLHGVPIETIPDFMLPPDALAIKYMAVVGEDDDASFSNKSVIDGRVVEQSTEMCASILPLLQEKHDFERSLIASVELRMKKGQRPTEKQFVALSNAFRRIAIGGEDE